MLDARVHSHTCNDNYGTQLCTCTCTSSWEARVDNLKAGGGGGGGPLKYV